MGWLLVIVGISFMGLGCVLEERVEKCSFRHISGVLSNIGGIAIIFLGLYHLIK